jgi:hypothetical protein
VLPLSEQVLVQKSTQLLKNPKDKGAGSFIVGSAGLKNSSENLGDSSVRAGGAGLKNLAGDSMLAR